MIMILMTSSLAFLSLLSI